MIAAAQCFNHAERLAAARCPECGHSYCRECITEHDGRLVCAVCLRKHSPAGLQRRNWYKAIALPVMGVAALSASWLVFYTAGWWLEEITAPSAGGASSSGAVRR
jgi:hypothetical protein